MFNPQKHPVTASQPHPLSILLYLFWVPKELISSDSCDSCDKVVISGGCSVSTCHNRHNVEPLENYTITQRRFKSLWGPVVRWVVDGGQSDCEPVFRRSVGGFGR